jgi:gliding motility-associated protein GldM
MAGGKETPRQKMIGMMYLVLTALLALNVSKEIVSAFVTLNNKLDQSTSLIERKNNAVYQDFENQFAVLAIRETVRPWREKALRISALANAAHDFYLSETNRLIQEVEGKSREWVEERDGKLRLSDLMEIGSKDDYDAATRLFVGDPSSINEAGRNLMKKMHLYRDSVCLILAEYKEGNKSFSFSPSFTGDSFSEEELSSALQSANPADTARIRQVYAMLTLPAEVSNHDERVAWQAGMFDHAPVVAAAALFTSLRNDVRSAEAVAIDHVYSKIKAEKFSFNKIEPMAFARTGYLNVGDSMDLNVMIAAYDSNEVSKIRFAVNDSNSSNFKDHTGKIKVRASRPGVYTMNGLITVKENGEEKWKPWSYRYEVGEPTGVVSNEDLTVIYAGYPHTFSASVSGFPQDRISLSIPGVTVNPKGGGKYAITAPGSLIGKKVKASISVRTENGGSKSFAGPEFSVKPLPTPTAYLGNLGLQNPDVTLSELKTNAQFLRVAYDASISLDPNKVRFTVRSFEMTATVGASSKSFSGTGPQLTPAMVNFIRVASPGTKVSFGNIVCQGPAGQQRVFPVEFKVR